MSWRKLLLLPALIRSGMRAPASAPAAWEAYWKGIHKTGAAGDVLWDPNHQAELDFCMDKARSHFEPALPVVDAGCGNGRFTRALATELGRAVGVDLSPSAVERARQETPAECRASFRVADLAERGAARQLSAELGEVNVFLRGVFHILDHESKLALADNVLELMGRDGKGKLFLLETAFPGSPLDYLEFLGATNGQLPAPLHRAVFSGLPKPARFSRAELARYLPASRFDVLESGDAPIFAVGMHPGVDVERIPGFYAVLGRRISEQPVNVSDATRAASDRS
jgi:SAM-dependent methyltransferase